MKISNEAEKYRVKHGIFKSDDGKPYGMFMIPSQYGNLLLKVIACEAGEETKWDHVSVSMRNRCPNWNEMNFIKDLFFEDEDTVVQFHPKKSEYVNNHPYCLHLWRKVGENVELPPKILVGI